MGVPSELESDFDHGGACKPGWPSSAGSERRYTAGSDTETALRVQHGLYVGEVPCRDGDPTESACEVSDSSFGEWTWVLVRSEDWKPLLLVRHSNSSNPACAFLPAKETFLEEALVLPVSSRGVELSVVWHMSMENLLDLAVRHELGHALCLERDEAEADRVAALLQEAMPVSCDRNSSEQNPLGRIRMQH
jgi:hypothetical protein